MDTEYCFELLLKIISVSLKIMVRLFLR